MKPMPSCAATFRSDCIPPESSVMPVPSRRFGLGRIPRWLALVACTANLAAQEIQKPQGAQESQEARKVAVLYNTRSPRSKEVAEFYARSRGVPTEQLIGLDCPSETSVTRTAYESQIQTPLRRILAERNLARFDAATPTRMTQTSIRYLLLVYGMPYRILNDTNRVEVPPGTFAPGLSGNGAAVEADLMVLPARSPYVITGPVKNPFFASTNAAGMVPENGIFLVSRLDGPTPEIAMGLVTKAMEAERDGLWGRAFLDLRGIKSGGYKVGDDWLGSAEAVCRLLGFETVVDRNEATLGAGFPLSDVAVYGGWYDLNASGPFALPSVDFRPGAIAYHLHSFSAQDLRSRDRNWVGPLLARGATVTMGCIDEPFLQMSPNFGAFMARFSTGMNFGEAGLACLPSLSWQTLLVGDPLYRPFSPDFFARTKVLEAKGSPLLPWTVVHRINFFIQNGGDPELARAELEGLPDAATDPVLADKIAQLYAAKSRLNQAVDWGRKSLAAGGTPPERARLLLELAAWQRTQDKPSDAYATLGQFVKEFPSHSAVLSVRRQQLGYAKDLKRAADVASLQAEVDRLAGPPSPPKK